jgi:hypothetical protein
MHRLHLCRHSSSFIIIIIIMGRSNKNNNSTSSDKKKSSHGSSSKKSRSSQHHRRVRDDDSQAKRDAAGRGGVGGGGQRGKEDKEEKEMEASREDRLLRKAKEYIQNEDDRKDRGHRHHRGDSAEEEDERKRDHRKKEEDRSSRRRHRHGDEDKDDRRHGSSRREHEKCRRDDDDDDDDDYSIEEEEDRKLRSKKKSSSSSKHSNKERKSSDSKKSSSRKHHKLSKDNHHDGKNDRKKMKSDKADKQQPSEQSTTKSHHLRTIPDKRFLVPLGERRGHAPDVLLNADTDYFRHHQHLWLFLFREEGLAFNDMTSSAETHTAFERFVQRYNAGDLEAAYYDTSSSESGGGGGLPPAAIEECKTTRHSWSFRITDTEDQTLHSIEKGVRQETEYKGTAAVVATSTTATAMTSRPRVDERKPAPRTVAPAPTAPDQGSQQQQQPPTTTYSSKEWVETRVANRRLREHAKTVTEELTGGKKDGHERLVEKKLELSAKIHGASRDARDQAVSGVELTDDAIYGSGDVGSGSFQEALEKEKQRLAARQEKQNTRVQELQAKEREKQEAMLKMLGLDNIRAGQKITIAPRNDG